MRALFFIMANKNLSAAKAAKNDEFYTLLTDVSEELKHYREHFRDKVVFCNCDDPTYSAFWQYFHLNFEKLGLRKLISTHYDKTQPTYKIEYAGGDDGNIEAGIITPLEGNGDFRNAECIELLKEADIVVTNPPFSLFREYVTQLMEYGKKFVIIGNMNAITYKEFFPLLKENKVWLGYRGNTPMTFRMPDYYELKGTSFIGADGHKYAKMGSCTWYTNLDISKRHEPLILWKQYTQEEYPKYDNYDAINVDRVSEIPCDYDGVMGVPITFLDKYCPEQFEIVGQGQGNLYRLLTEKGLSQQFVDDYYKSGQTGSIKENHPVLGYYSASGKPVIPYMRILIRRK